MRQAQKDLLLKHIRLDIVMMAFVLLLLLDNWVGQVAGALYTIYIVIIWACVINATGSIYEQVKSEEGLSWQLFAFNLLNFVFVLLILINSPLDSLWMGVVAGLYCITAVAGATMHVMAMRRRR